MKSQTETPPANPTQEVPPVNVDDPTGVEGVTQELTDVTAYTLIDVLMRVLVALGAILVVLLTAVGTITYIALKFVHRSVTPEAVKDIFLLGVDKGMQGLTDAAKRLQMPYELDDKFIGAIASGVGRYFAEIGYTPNGNKDTPVPPPETKKPPTDATPLGG